MDPETDTPVTLPPGRASDSTRPPPTGLVAIANTIGMVNVTWAEFVKIRADVIVTAGSAVPAIKPDQQADLASKRVELLREAIPGLHRLAVISAKRSVLPCPQRYSIATVPILANVGYHDSVFELADVETTARRLGLEAVRLEIRRAENIAPAFQALKGQADALYVVSDGLVSANRARIIAPVSIGSTRGVQ